MGIGYRWWAAAAVLAVLLVGARGLRHFSAVKPLHPGDRLAPLTLSSLAGQPFTLGPAGHPQLINVFATWCPPCRAETPQLAVLARRLQASGVDVVGIDQEESEPQVSRFRDAFALTYPVYIDEQNITHSILGARVIPETLYVDAGGVIRWMREGPLDTLEMQTIARTAGRQV